MKGVLYKELLKPGETIILYPTKLLFLSISKKNQIHNIFLKIINLNLTKTHYTLYDVALKLGQKILQVVRHKL